MNLREHWGQAFFDEVLERHARSIGFTPKEDLVIAWRAGLACILLDGFDEVASQTIVRSNDKNFMREARYAALSGVRDFLQKLPSGSGAFVCGRDHYFDGEAELAHSLGIAGKPYKLARLDEFTETGASAFLEKNGLQGPLPDWLPRKPLILAYLVQNDLLSHILSIDASEGYGYAWDAFLTKIAQREAELERAAMDPQTVRNVMERLAFSVRSSLSGTGPITGNDLAKAYQNETGQAAGEGVLAQLQRLPGLTQREQEAGSRSFVDIDMLAALQGSAFARIIWGQYEGFEDTAISALSEKAISVAAFLLSREGDTSATPLSNAERYASERGTQGPPQLVADCVALALTMAREENCSVDFRGTIVSTAALTRIDLDESMATNVTFKDCIIDEVSIGAGSVDSGVKFFSCIIKRVCGVANAKGLPDRMFGENCEIGEFDDMGTNNAVLQLDIDPQVKALLTILRKLYRQAGAGRKVSALNRGITKQEVLKYLSPVIETLQKHGFVRIFNTVVHPVRRQSNRVDQILNAPSISTDELVIDVKKLRE